MERVAVTELGYACFGVSDMGAWRSFASDILGIEFVEADGRARLRTDYWHHRIILESGDDDDLRYAGWRVAGPEEFALMQRQLSHYGVTFEVCSASQADERNVLELMRLNDPCGTLLEIFHGPRVDLHAPMRPGRGMHGRFINGPGGLGHLVLNQSDTEALRRFYGVALGMRGAVEVDFRLPSQRYRTVFMSCNTRGHTIAFGAPGSSRRIHHLMIEVSSLDDVGLAFDLIKQQGLEILLDLGRHGNDRMFSFYVATPSGWFLEYGWGGAPPLSQSEYNLRDIWGHALLNRSFG